MRATNDFFKKWCDDSVPELDEESIKESIDEPDGDEESSDDLANDDTGGANLGQNAELFEENEEDSQSPNQANPLAFTR